MTLQETLANLPHQPGIYQYFDDNHRLLYVGKAKNLKKRVSSYFRMTPTLSPAPNVGPRIYKMLTETVSLEYIIVESEHDALILENSLIKQLKPKYNILLRDDKTYPYIIIDQSKPFPRFEITRRIIKGKGIKYFGPFSTSANEILQGIYDLFPLVQKKGCLEGGKACLFHQINKCLAPCEGKVSKEAYDKITQEAMAVIHDRKKLIRMLQTKMEHYSENLLFEEAAKLRDSIDKIDKANVLSHVDMAKLEDIDVFAVALGEMRAVGVRIFIREGKVASSSFAHFKSDNGFDVSELYKVLLLEYYNHELPYTPKQILTFEEFEDKEDIEALLGDRYSRKIEIKVPQKGERKKLTELAYKNGQEILRLEANKNSTQILTELKELLHLQKTPFEIEGYDNSHMMGQATVGAVIKWNETFIKKEYRHYNLEAKDEYAQMKEMLERRVESFDKNPPPDLMVIDGGEALLNLAIKIVKQKSVFVDIIAIAKEKRDAKAMRAKGKAYDLIYTKEGVLKLSPSDKRLQFLQNIRDESHRFAITFFKKQKLKADKKISLLGKKGIGEATVRKLLQYFETFDNIENATLEELEKVVGTKVAESIKNI